MAAQQIAPGNQGLRISPPGTSQVVPHRCGRRRMTSARHIPVLAREAIEMLAPREGSIFIDATFGAGGYSGAILDTPGTRVIGLDRGRSAIAGGFDLVDRSGGRLTLVGGRLFPLPQNFAAQNNRGGGGGGKGGGGAPEETR